MFPERFRNFTWELPDGHAEGASKECTELGGESQPLMDARGTVLFGVKFPAPFSSGQRKEHKD